MRRVLALILAVMLSLCLAACQQEDSGHFTLTDGNPRSETEDEDDNPQVSGLAQGNSNILIAYDPAQQSVVQAAEILADTLSGDLLEVEQDDSLLADAYEYVLLGFAPDGDALPQTIENFWDATILGRAPFIPLCWVMAMQLIPQVCIPLSPRFSREP